jgi:hypothetical protein
MPLAPRVRLLTIQIFYSSNIEDPDALTELAPYYVTLLSKRNRDIFGLTMRSHYNKRKDGLRYFGKFLL